MNGWADANQRAVQTDLARVRAALDGDVAAPRPPGDFAVDRLVALFRLSAFERDVLVLCAGVELDSGLADACARAHGDPGRRWATFGLALAALPDAHWSALAPCSALRHWQLLAIADGDSVTSGALRIDERVLHYVAGVEYLDPRLAALLEPADDRPLAPSQATTAERLAGRLRRDGVTARVALCGADPRSRRRVASAAAGELGLQALTLRAEHLPAGPEERGRLARLVEREVALAGALLVVESQDEPERDRAALESFVDGLGTAVVLSAREPLSGLARPGLRIDATGPTLSEQRVLWTDALGPRAAELDGGLDRLVAHFDVDAGTIGEAAAGATGADDLLTDLWNECRVQARPRLDELAERIESGADWDDLVLPAAQRDMLRQIIAQVRTRTIVHERWGFARRSARGLGLAALFSGTAGTGKTMAAEVLARELVLDLYRIDLSAVVSKYIGQTEKNLRRVFDSAEGSGAILLFDEADALFGKRTEVRDSHDRYANIEVSYLLQRMEAYRGLAILTTNVEAALDHAFMRRLRFVVRFPFPDVEHRREIWRRTFPSATPVASVDIDALARLDVAGGNIRNIAVNAAFLAADGVGEVRMEHILAAARSEYAKLERPLSELDLEARR